MRCNGSGTTLLWIALLASCLVGCSHTNTEHGNTAVSLPVTDVVNQPRWKTPSSAFLGERNRCIDEELARRNLNGFGDDVDTTYTHGAPQGVATTLDRYSYVLKRQPDIATSCTKNPVDLER
jgi:hypothetical protein